MGHQKMCCAKMSLGFRKEGARSAILKPPVNPISIFLWLIVTCLDFHFQLRVVMHFVIGS